jgi:mannose/cellobiose epimerase-like protein (N-acyl-D-glucosamine 2-epimerase family)
MTTKHTPGPWKVVGKTRDGVRGPAGNMIAECIGYSDKATDPIQRAYGGRESNARLIAASPELFDACVEMLKVAEAFQAGSRDGATMGTISLAMDKARAAVARIDS